MCRGPLKYRYAIDMIVFGIITCRCMSKFKRQIIDRMHRRILFMLIIYVNTINIMSIMLS